MRDVGPDTPTLAEREFIMNAFTRLNQPRLMIRLANFAGKPMTKTLDRLPKRVLSMINRATERALDAGLKGALETLPATDGGEGPARAKKTARRHSWLAAGSGVAAGLFGGLAFPIELATTTTLILRAIALIAREYGFDPNDPAVRAECLYVLTLGTGRGEAGVAMDASYLASRLALRGWIEKGASGAVLSRVVSEVAKRFEVVAAEKLVGGFVPVVAAIGGGAINKLFADHFTEAAIDHFGLRALERKYGEARVHAIYRGETQSETT